MLTRIPRTRLPRACLGTTPDDRIHDARPACTERTVQLETQHRDQLQPVFRAAWLPRRTSKDAAGSMHCLCFLGARQRLFQQRCDELVERYWLYCGPIAHDTNRKRTHSITDESNKVHGHAEGDAGRGNR